MLQDAPVWQVCLHHLWLLWLTTPDRTHTDCALVAQRSVQQLVMVYVTVGDLAEGPLPLPLHLRQFVSY